MKKAKRSARKETLLKPLRPPKAGHPPVTYSHRLVELQHRAEAEVKASEVAGSRSAETRRLILAAARSAQVWAPSA